jgi:DNA-binding transcriptional LysR family regulator
LADQPWAWIPREVSPDYHDVLIAGCRQAGFSPDVRHRATSIQSQLAMVACGLGVGLVPQTAAVPLPGVEYLPLAVAIPLVELAIVWRSSDVQPLTTVFVECATASQRAEPT